MAILAWIVLGAVAGFIANLLIGGREGAVATVILGIAGALLGGFVAATVLHLGSVSGLNLESIVISAVGAAAVLAAWHVLFPRRRVFRF